MVRVTSSGSGMAAFDTAPDTLTTSSGSGSSSSTGPILTTPVLSVAFAAKLSTWFELSLKSSSVAGSTGSADTVTVKGTGEAGDTVAVTVIHPAFSRGSSLLRCSVTSSPGGISGGGPSGSMYVIRIVCIWPDAHVSPVGLKKRMFGPLS